MADNNVVIDDVTIIDAKELLMIYGLYVKETAISFEYEIPSIKEFEERIVNITAKYPYIKAVKDGEIVGYAYANTFKGRKAYDWSVETTIYVKSDNKRDGIGRLLYDQLEIRLKDMGILNMNACIACPTMSSEYLTDDSIKFHKKMGFTEAGHFHNCGYKFEQWFDMVWMEKMIGEHDNHPKEVCYRN